MKNLISHLPFFSLSIVTIALILYLTLAPEPIGADRMPAIPGLDKLVHALMFGWLTLMLCIDYSRKWHDFSAVPLKIILIFGLFSTLFGGAIELFQQMMEFGRTADWADFMADAAGCIVFGALANSTLKIIRRW